MKDDYLIKTAFLDGQKISQHMSLALTKYMNKMLHYAKTKEYGKWSDIVIKLYNNYHLIMSQELIDFISGNFNEKNNSDYMYAFMAGANNEYSREEVDKIILSLDGAK